MPVPFPAPVQMRQRGDRRIFAHVIGRLRKLREGLKMEGDSCLGAPLRRLRSHRFRIRP